MVGREVKMEGTEGGVRVNKHAVGVLGYSVPRRARVGAAKGWTRRDETPVN